jgi:hypothetical protein
MKKTCSKRDQETFPQTALVVSLFKDEPDCEYVKHGKHMVGEIDIAFNSFDYASGQSLKIFF